MAATRRFLAYIAEKIMRATNLHHPDTCLRLSRIQGHASISMMLWSGCRTISLNCRIL